MKIALWPIDKVKPYEKNPRKNAAAVAAVARAIAEFGFRQPIIVDRDGVVVVGHTRLLAAKQLGLDKVPVHVAGDLTPSQAKAYRIADNQTATIADWDAQLLPLEIGELRDESFDLGLLGFDAKELARIMTGDAKPGLTDPDETPPLPGKPETQRGDLWLLGEHRVLCGDSTRPEDLARLMRDEKARTTFTDPPWNVAIGLDLNPRHKQRPGLKNDKLPAEDFAAFLARFVETISPLVAGDFYCILGATEWPTLDATLRGLGFHWSATIIWAKDIFVLGRSNYHRRYEPIWYGWKKGAVSSFVGRRDLDDVWDVARPRRSDEHPTMKPVELPLRAIRNSSVSGDIVLDPFGGAGSTLIAAEQSERRARLVEIEPGFVDIIVRRWEAFAGKKAERIAAGDESPRRLASRPRSTAKRKTKKPGRGRVRAAR